jgi:hypothetical protein
MVDGVFGFSQRYIGNDFLSLRPGQIVPGIVLEVTSDNAVVLLNGINVVAELETPVVPGEKLRLQVVEKMPDDKMLLRKVDSGGQGESPISQKDMESLLNHFGVKNTPMNEEIVRGLLGQKVALTQRNIELLSNFALKHNVSLEEVPALAWLWARGLPITKESITAVMSLMEGRFQDPKMAQLLQTLGQGTSGGIQEGTFVPGNFDSAVLDSVKNLLLMPQEELSQWAQKIRGTLEALGAGHERDVMRFLEEFEGGRGLNEIQDLKALLAGNESRTLKAALMGMLQAGNSPVNSQLTRIASGLLKDITGLQLLNLFGQSDGEGTVSYLPGWVMLQDNDIQPFFLKIKQYQGAFSEQEYRCQVLFFISTKGLGEVMCRLALERDCLTCGFTLRGQEECRLLDSMLPVLKERLECLPWKTVIYPSTVSRGEEIQETWYKEVFLTHEKVYKGLDARV